MRNKVVILGTLIVLCSSPVGLAGDATVRNDGSVTWQAGVDGVEIEWNADGSVRRLYSRYATPVEFPDRRGIAKAQIIAEEKAKANIVRFLKQDITSARIVGEIQADVNKATQHRQTGSAATVSKVDERTVMDSLTEVTGSFATGTLTGVIVLEKGYDDKTQEAWTVVGVSEKTIGAARGVRGKMIEPDVSEPSGSLNQPNFGLQRGEVRRSRQRDW